jgi:hypothetical protein
MRHRHAGSFEAASTKPTLAGGRARPAGWSLAISFVLAGLIVSAVMAVRSTGVHHEDDLTHLQIARWAWQHPAYLLDDWGRPGFTALYALPAGLGWLPARLFSGLLTAASAWLAYLVAVQLRVRLAAFVPLFLWIQPLSFTLSYTTLTETALAFYLSLACWLYVRGRFAWSAAAISLCAITRHEAALFLVMWLAALLYRARPAREWLWVFWAPLLHNLLAFAFLREWPLKLLLQPHPTSEYGQGSLLTMIVLWVLAAGFGTLLLAIIGAPVLARRRGGLLFVSSAAAYVAAHSVMYGFGLFGSGGYARFLVPVGPVVAVYAAAALSEYRRAWRRWAVGPQNLPLLNVNAIGAAAVIVFWGAAGLELHRLRADLIINHLVWTVPLLHAAALMLMLLFFTVLVLSSQQNMARPTLALAVLPITALAAALLQPLAVSTIPRPFRQCAPLQLTDREKAHRTAAQIARAATGSLSDHQTTGAAIFSASPWIDEFVGRVRPPVEPDLAQRWESSRAGDVLIWDARHAASPRHRLPLSALTADPDLVELWRSTGDAYEPVYCAVFQKRPQREAPRQRPEATGPN